MNHYAKTPLTKLLLTIACFAVIFTLSSCNDGNGNVNYIEGGTEAAATNTPTVAPTETPIETAPAETTDSAPSETPDETSPEDSAEYEITVESVTTPVKRGENATVTIKAGPGVIYKLQVYYPSGESKAAGLGEAVADADGYASWTWKIGVNTSVGDHYAVVSGGNNSVRIEFTVEE